MDRIVGAVSYTHLAEYLYGSRKDMNSMKNHANRVNVMVQYNF